MTVCSIPMRTRFRGITVREGVLIRGAGRLGRVEPVPGVRRRRVAEPWLRCAEEAAAGDWPAPVRDRCPVNVTVPAVGPERAHEIVRGRRLPHRQGQGRRARPDPRPTTWPGSRRCATRSGRTAGSGSTPTAAGTSTSAVAAIRALDRAAGGLEYVEQPCATVEELAAVRRAVDVPIAADESIRRADDPYRVRDLEAADIAVLKVQPLGGVRACLRIAEEIGLPVVVSSRAGDLGRHRRRGRAGRRAARAALRLRPGHRAAAHRRRGRRAAAAGRRRCCRSACRRSTRRAGPARRRPRTGSRTGRPRLAAVRARAAGSPLVTHPVDRRWPARSSTRWSRPASPRSCSRPGSRNAPLVVRGVRRRRGRAAAAAHPDRRAHRRLPRPRADQGRRAGPRWSARPAPPSPTCTRPCSRPRTPGCRWSSSPPTGRPGCAAPAPTRPPTRSASSAPSRVADPSTVDRRAGARPSPDRRGRRPSAAAPACTSTSSSTSRWCPTDRWQPDARRPAEPAGAAAPGAVPRRDRSRSGPRTVVVAGDDAGPPARVLAETAGWPLLAEPTSGSRTGANALRCYRLLLDGDLGARDRAGRRGRPPDPVAAGHPAARPRRRRGRARRRRAGVWAERPFPVDRSAARRPPSTAPTTRPGSSAWRDADRVGRPRSSTRCWPPRPTSRRTRSPARSAAPLPPERAAASSAPPARSATST